MKSRFRSLGALLFAGALALVASGGFISTDRAEAATVTNAPVVISSPIVLHDGGDCPFGGY